MVDEHLRRYIKEKWMDWSSIPETKGAREFRLFAEERARLLGIPQDRAIGAALRAGLAAWKREEAAIAKGERQALLTVLAARGLTPSPLEQEQIDALEDHRVIKRSLRRAVTAATVAEVLAPPGTRRKRSRA